jgi:NAD-dependent deacetylase
MFIPPELTTLFRSAARVAVLTGAGVSAESGVPTFRDTQSGLWAKFNPAELATLEAFARNPALVWDWYAWRRELVARVEPNPGHLALAALEAGLVQGGARFTLITQNVDGLHQRAGSRNVIELHGNILRVKCSADDAVVESWPPTGETPPHCPDCGAALRPDVVWFGERLPPEAISAAERAATESDIFISVGTSAEIQPAASLPWLALGQHAVVVEINPEATPLTPQATYVLAGPSGVVLPQLVKAVWPRAPDMA